MNSLYQFSLKLKNYKCFGNKEQGFDQIRPLNLILGRNNSGKSTLLDFIEDFGKQNLATKRLKDFPRGSRGEITKEARQTVAEMINTPKEIWHRNVEPEIIIEFELEEKYLKNHFFERFQTNFKSSEVSSILLTESSDLSGFIHTNPYLNFWHIGKQYINKKVAIRYSLQLINKYGSDSVEPVKELIRVSFEDNYPDPLMYLSSFIEENHNHRTLSSLKKDKQNLESALSKCVLEQFNSCVESFTEKHFKRIYPDRNILPEEDNINDLGVSGDGRGVTNIIQNFYNQEVLDRNVVENNILKDLNQIFRGDAEFLNITPRKKTDGRWEIALQEENKGLISLSQSGSSLKTVMILLVYLHLIPIVEKENLSNYVFLIEELENNLHPSLLRRLLSYISKKTRKDNCVFFIATHSSVAIDMFSGDKDAQIIHVTHDSKSSNIGVVDTHLDGIAILNDIGVRASDLLQANGIIWVEGPSDVIYIEKWLEMYCKENKKAILNRGLEYDFQMYGGAILDSLYLIKSGLNSKKEEQKKLVSMLSFSRNAFVVIDSDAVK